MVNVAGVYQIVDHGGTDRDGGTQLTTTSHEDADTDGKNHGK